MPDAATHQDTVCIGVYDLTGCVQMVTGLVRPNYLVFGTTVIVSITPPNFGNILH